MTTAMGHRLVVAAVGSFALIVIALAAVAVITSPV
jgi:hypothetical protein